MAAEPLYDSARTDGPSAAVFPYTLDQIVSGGGVDWFPPSRTPEP